MVSVQPEAWVHSVRWQGVSLKILTISVDLKVACFGVTVMKCPDFACAVSRTSVQTTKLLEFLALMVRLSWNHHAPERSEGRRHKNIVAAGHGSIISCRVEQLGVVDGDDHQHALCA